MNTVALEKIVEQMKALEELCFASHRDSAHPENCKWGVAWKAQEEARKAVEGLILSHGCELDELRPYGTD